MTGANGDAAADTAAGWATFCTRLAEAGAILDDPRIAGSPDLRAEGVRYLLHLLNSGLDMYVMSADADHPEVARAQDCTKRWALECPDAAYGRATISSEGTYRVVGNPGNPRYLGISVSSGQLGTADLRVPGSISSPGALARASDGSFELVVGGEPVPGNWIPTEPGVDALSIRQFLYDWDTETPCRITVERIDRGVEPPPVVDADRYLGQLSTLGDFVLGSTRTWSAYVEHLRSTSHNTIQPPNRPNNQYGATADQVYGGGFLDLAPDEAAIVEFEPPPCNYWQLQVGDRWFQSLDYTYRQTSLNGHQAALNPDGTFVAVVAHVDPGIANWLDTAGHRELPITYRFQLAECPFDDLPTPAVRIAPIAELAGHLPPDTPPITLAERAASLQRRRDAVRRRYQR